MGVTTNGLPAMAASGNRTAAVVLAPDHGLLWTSWELGQGHGPWTDVPISGVAHLTDVAPVVSFRTTEGGASVWLALRDFQDNRIYETLQQPDGTFGDWSLVPATRTDSSPNGWTTNVSPSASDGNLAIGAPIMLALAAPPDDQTYVNVNIGDQPPAPIPPAPNGYWQAIVPSPWTTLAPALAVVDSGNYMFVLASVVDVESTNLHLVLGQGSPYTPSSLSAPWEDQGFETNLSPAIASANNRTVAVAVDPTGAMFYNWWDLGGGAQGWTPLGTDVTTTVRPAVALVDNGNYIFVLARDVGGELFLFQGNVGGPLVGWEPAETPGNQ